MISGDQWGDLSRVPAGKSSDSCDEKHVAVKTVKLELNNPGNWKVWTPKWRKKGKRVVYARISYLNQRQDS
jgi:predicted site-specific integrase-resolvase